MGGFGAPSQRDLDLGRHLVTYLEPLGWPEHVVVEDLSYSAHLVLHRLQELQPRKLVLVGAVASGRETPGSVRRRPVPPLPADPRRAHEELAASLGGPVDVDHTLSVLRHWGGLPPDTVVIEVEPSDCSFGLGFSEAVADCFDDVVAMVREEIHMDGPVESLPAAPRLSPADGMSTLIDYADRRKKARQEDRHRGGVLLERLPENCGVEVATRSRPWGMGLNGGGDWYDVMGLPDGWVAAVIGDAPGRGMEAVGLKADLRVAAQAYTVLCGPRPAEIVRLLDRFVAATARGSETTVAVLALHARTGELRLCSAGHCPPLVVDSAGSWFVHDAFTPALGPGLVERTELRATLATTATVLLFTDGLLERHDQPLAMGLLKMLEAATYRDGGLEALCDAVLTSCIDRRRREDDASLLALRLSAAA